MINNKDDNFNSELKLSQKEHLSDLHKTKINKNNFINAIKHGLGEEIRRDANKPLFIKKKWYKLMFNFIKKFFINFKPY